MIKILGAVYPWSGLSSEGRHDRFKIVVFPLVTGLPLLLLAGYGLGWLFLFLLIPLCFFAYGHLLGSYYRTHFE